MAKHSGGGFGRSAAIAGGSLAILYVVTQGLPSCSSSGSSTSDAKPDSVTSQGQDAHSDKGNDKGTPQPSAQPQQPASTTAAPIAQKDSATINGFNIQRVALRKSWGSTKYGLQVTKPGQNWTLWVVDKDSLPWGWKDKLQSAAKSGNPNTGMEAEVGDKLTCAVVPSSWVKRNLGIGLDQILNASSIDMLKGINTGDTALCGAGL